MGGQAAGGWVGGLAGGRGRKFNPKWLTASIPKLAGCVSDQQAGRRASGKELESELAGSLNSETRNLKSGSVRGIFKQIPTVAHRCKNNAGHQIKKDGEVLSRSGLL